MMSSVSDQNGYIKIAAFDHRDSIKKFVPEELISDFKNLLTAELGPVTTAVLVDPFYGQKAISTANQNGTKLILSREESGYTDNPDGRLTVLSKNTSNDLKEMGASAIKMLVYFNPDSKNANEQVEIVKKVASECKEINLPFLLEPITYQIANVPYNKPEAILKTLEIFGPIADILKIEYPTDVETEPLELAVPYMQQITHILDKKPWILLSRGNMTFEKYMEAVTICKNNGASGYAVGRAVWQEVKDYKNWNEIENFVKTTVKERMIKLSQLF
ncbi:MAG: tagatose 1,6-diphosphate aldolase [Patescibacteria group bacterium]|nr:tagatose 1,6-diphosphate aldolase [Patescibacteria group bacterium]